MAPPSHATKAQEVRKNSLGGLEHIFGSKTRELILRFLLLNSRPFFLREIARTLDQHVNAIRRELERLSRMGLVVIESGEKRKKFYRINTAHVFYPELKALAVKSHFLVRSHFLDRLERIGSPACVLLTGFFTGTDSPTDIVIIGLVPREEFLGFLRSYERELAREINYTILSLPELRYRIAVTDRFLQHIIRNPHIVLVNRLKKDDQVLFAL